jgi:hypothetical protein
MCRFFFAAALSFVCAGPASAVVLFSSPNSNTTAPTDPGELTAWNYTGNFRGFVGTPIGSQYFIAAQHIDAGVIGNPGDAANDFSYQGTTYTEQAFYNVPGTDLQVWKVNGTFSSWAPVWNDSVDGSEVGKNLFVVGNGVSRGAAVNDSSSNLRGWLLGGPGNNNPTSWGENNVTGLADFATNGDKQLLKFNFDASGPGNVGANEAAITTDDSGGGLFIESGGVWKLAAINLGVDSPWSFTNPNTDPNAQQFNADIFDSTGLWEQDTPGHWVQSAGGPGASYSSRISPNLQNIEDNFTGLLPEPASLAIIALAASLPMRRARRSLNS